MDATNAMRIAVVKWAEDEKLDDESIERSLKNPKDSQSIPVPETGEL